MKQGITFFTSILLLCTVFFTIDISASGIPFTKGIAFVTEINPAGEIKYTSAFFFGDRGYLFTVLTHAQPKSLAGKIFDVQFVDADGKLQQQKAVVVDLNENSGIALLHLVDSKFPFKEPLLTTDDIGQPHKLPTDPNEKVSFVYAKKKEPYFDVAHCHITSLESENGRLKFDKLDPSPFVESMAGAPVFWKGVLIGIVADNSTIHPINHAVPYVTMAESTIIGKKIIQELVQSMAQNESLLSDKNRAEWKEIIAVLAFIQASTTIVPEIKSDDVQDFAGAYSLVLKFERPVDVMKIPQSVIVKGYPQFSYFDKAGDQERKVVKWQEVEKAVTNESDDVIFKYTYKNLKHTDSEANTPIPLIKIKPAIGRAYKLNDEQLTKLRVDSIHVILECEIEVTGGRKIPCKAKADLKLEGPR